ncbi:MAG TPA: hypothetical protein VKQ32_29475 [Polyangia bacterium]|nr:hypothetical protein [Polyangia bacterium]
MMADVDRLGAACAIAVFAVVLTAPARARCEGLRLALGTGVASRSVGSGIAFPFELTLQAFPAVSISGGAVAADGTIVYAYGEVALNLGVSFGAGGGVGGYSAPGGVVDGAAFHLLLALPIPFYPPDFLSNPVGFVDHPWWVYLLPYYRPTWGPWSGVAHELGVMLKVSREITHHRTKIGG